MASFVERGPNVYTHYVSLVLQEDSPCRVRYDRYRSSCEVVITCRILISGGHYIWTLYVWMSLQINSLCELDITERFFM